MNDAVCGSSVSRVPDGVLPLSMSMSVCTPRADGVVYSCVMSGAIFGPDDTMIWRINYGRTALPGESVGIDRCVYLRVPPGPNSPTISEALMRMYHENMISPFDASLLAEKAYHMIQSHGGAPMVDITSIWTT